MTDFPRHKHTQPDTILDPELKAFDRALEGACDHLLCTGWNAIAWRLWDKWLRLLPRLTVGYVPEEPEPPPNWYAEEGTEELHAICATIPPTIEELE